MPVIIITGYGSVRSAVQAMKLGAADYIEKPFEPATTRQAIATAVRRKRFETGKATDHFTIGMKSSKCWKWQPSMTSSGRKSSKTAPMR